jgi:uncharacterized protein with beta-barrel porin domain
MAIAALLLVSDLAVFAEDLNPRYRESVQLAADHASSPAGWQPASLFVIPDVPGGNEGLVYDGGKLIVRTATRSRNFQGNYVGQTGYKIYGPPTTDAAWVTTGNDATKFLLANGVDGANVTTLLERGLGMDATGTHDAVVEFAVDPRYLMRPTRNPDITQYLPAQYGADLPFVQPAGMSDEAFNDFKSYYENWRAGAYGQYPFPWTQLGYSFFWGNGYAPDKINGMSEFILLGQSPAEIYGIYATRSYIYTRNDGTGFSSAADAAYGNGFASFRIDGSCDTVWAGHRFQKKVSDDPAAPNRIIITGDGSVSGGQGILVWSLNYDVQNDGVISGATARKFGGDDTEGTENIALLFKGDTSARYGAPVMNGINRLTNAGTILSSGTAVKAEAGDTRIVNKGDGILSGGDYAVQTGPGNDRVAVKGGGVSGGVSAIDTGGGKDKVTVKGGVVSGGTSAIVTGAGKDKVAIKGGVVQGGENAIRTGNGDDTVVVKGGEITGRIDMGAGSDTFKVKDGAAARFNFTLDVNAASIGQILDAEVVKIADDSAAIGMTVAGAGNVKSNDRFLIVEAATLNVDPAKLAILGDSTRPMLAFSAEKTGNSLSLVAARDGSYYGRLSGNASLGSLIDSLAETASGDMSTVLGALDGSGDPGAARQLEPTVNGGGPQSGFETAGLFHQALLNRIGQVLEGRSAATGVTTGIPTGDAPDREGVWGQGFGALLRNDPKAARDGYRAEIRGGSFGYDRFVFDHMMAGFGGGYARNRITGLDDRSRIDIDSYQGHLYGSLARDAYRIDALLSFAYNRYDTSRRIAFGGIDRTAAGEYGGQHYSGLLEGGYAIPKGGFVITPLVSLQVMRLHINGYTETGAGAPDLGVEAQDYNLFEAGLGAKLAYPIRNREVRIIPEVHAKWRYDFVGDRQQSTSRFSGSGASFTAEGVEPAQSACNVGAKLTLMTKADVTISLNYDFERRADFYGHMGSLSVRYAF